MKIMVLSDGETYSELEGCKIIEISDDMSTVEIEEALRAMKKGVNVIEEFKNVKYTPRYSDMPSWRNRRPLGSYLDPRNP